jgi:alpha-1,2-mannosyltransferase
LKYFRSPAFLVTLLALLPIIVISLMGEHYSATIRSIIPIDVNVTNFDAMRYVAETVFFSEGRKDSWMPIMEALNQVREGNRTNLYESIFFTKFIRFQYPPTSLLPFDLLSKLKPLSFRELNAINFVVYCINAAAAGAVAWELFQRAPRHQPGTGRPVSAGGLDPVGMAALAIIAAFCFFPLIRGLALGQVQIWIDALFTFAILFWIKRRQWAAGLCIGLACTIKPQFALLLIWGLLWRERSFCLGILAGSLPIVAVSLLLYGLGNHLDYLNVLAFLSRNGEQFFANNSVNGIFHSYFSAANNLHWEASGLTPYVPIVYAATVVASMAALVLLILPPLLWQNTQPGVADFCVASICTVVGSPVAWEHHYGILLPMYLVALRYAIDIPVASRRMLAFGTMLVSWILVANFIPFVHFMARTPFRFAQSHCFFGALLLAALLLTFHARRELGDKSPDSNRDGERASEGRQPSPLVA